MMRLKQRGDTIVEVMIVLAILGLAFAIASTTAIKGLDQSRNAQEHSRALGIANSQVEMVRTYIAAKKSLPPSGQFCMKHNGTAPEYKTDLAGECVDTTEAAQYQSVITANPDGNYTFEVKWPGTADLGPQRELIYYRINELLNSTIAEISEDGGSPPPSGYRVNVSARYLSPASIDATVNCGVPTGSQPLSGVNLKLIGIGYTNEKASNAAGNASFDTGLSNRLYTASFGSLPNGFSTCPPQSTTLTPANKTGSANLYAIPQVWTHDGAPFDGCELHDNGGDGKDECQRAGTRMFMFRSAAVIYNTPLTKSGRACLLVRFGQYEYGNRRVPPGYPGYKFKISINDGTVKDVTLVPNATGPTVTSICGITIPSVPAKLKLYWTNNDDYPPNRTLYDPNPYISKLQMYYQP